MAFLSWSILVQGRYAVHKRIGIAATMVRVMTLRMDRLTAGRTGQAGQDVRKLVMVKLGKKIRLKLRRFRIMSKLIPLHQS